jgi:hypothetical protein
VELSSGEKHYIKDDKSVNTSNRDNLKSMTSQQQL